MIFAAYLVSVQKARYWSCTCFEISHWRRSIPWISILLAPYYRTFYISRL